MESKFRKCKKKFRKYFSFLRQMDLKILHKFAYVKKRVLVIGSKWINKKK